MSAYGENGFDRAGRTVCGECKSQLDNDSNCRCERYTAVPMSMPGAREAVAGHVRPGGHLRVSQVIRADLPPTVALHEVAEAARGKLGRGPVKFELVHTLTSEGMKWCEWRVE